MYFQSQPKKILQDCFVPRYYWKSQRDEIRQKTNMYLISLMVRKNINTYKEHGYPLSYSQKQGHILYIRDMIKWYKILIQWLIMFIHLWKAEYIYKKKIFIKRGRSRIPFDKEVWRTNEITVWRVHPDHWIWFYFLFALSHEITKIQIKNKAVESAKGGSF